MAKMSKKAKAKMMAKGMKKFAMMSWMMTNHVQHTTKRTEEDLAECLNLSGKKVNNLCVNMVKSVTKGEVNYITLAGLRAFERMFNPEDSIPGAPSCEQLLPLGRELA